MLNARALILRKKVGNKTGSFHKLFECESVLRNNEHYLSSDENNAWKKLRPVQDLNPKLYYTGVIFLQALFSLLLR